MQALRAIAPVTAPSRRRLGALHHRGYRRFLAAQSIGSVGTWMQGVAQAWLALELTHSALPVGLVVTAQNLPVLIGGPFGGLVADRFSKRRVLVLTQALFAVPAIGLFALAVTRSVSYPTVVAAAALWGCVQVIDLPSRQAAAIDLVGRNDLLQAIACNASAWHVASVIGPSLAGAVIGVAGPGPCLLCTAACYLAAIGFLLRMEGPHPQARPPRPLLHGVAEAVSCVRHDRVLGSLLGLAAVFSLFAMNRLTLVPLFADQVLRVGAPGFGFLMATSGLGALGAGIALALRARPLAGSVHFWIGVIWALALIGFSASRQLWLSALLLAVIGVGQEWFMAAALTRIQMDAPDHLRGRVLAFYGQALTGVAPIGAAQSGLLASFVGPALAMATGAIVAGSAALFVRLVIPAVFAPAPAQRPGMARPALRARPPASAAPPGRDAATWASPPPTQCPTHTTGRRPLRPGR